MKKKKLKGPVLELFQKIDWEGGISGFIGWGGLSDDITKAVKKADPKLAASMENVKKALEAFDKECERYDDYDGCDD